MWDPLRGDPLRKNRRLTRAQVNFTTDYTDNTDTDTIQKKW